MDISIYKQIIEECFPKIRVFSIQCLDEGIYRVFEINSNLIFRFPYGDDGKALKREKILCNYLHSMLSIPIPYYEYFSNGCPRFDRPIAGYKKLDGVALDRCRLNASELKHLASQIGKFLSELHHLRLKPSIEVHITPFRHNQAKKWLKHLYQQIHKSIFSILSEQEQKWVKSFFEEFLDDNQNWKFTPVLIHGDFDSSNILYDQSCRTICGIIDFEETNPGDPAWDFCCLLAEFGQGFLRNMINNYKGAVDDNLYERISFHAKRTVFHEILYGLEFNKREFKEHGLSRMRRAMSNCDIIGGWLQKSTSETRDYDF